MNKIKIKKSIGTIIAVTTVSQNRCKHFEENVSMA
jgi:hypothetical protein